MTESEISEIREAIKVIHHVCDDDPLMGWKYDMLRAVLPFLERADKLAQESKHLYSDILTMSHALSIARVVNQKRPNTYTNVITDEATPVADIKKRARIQKLKKGDERLYVDFPISKSKLAQLKAEGRIIEKPKDK